MDYTTNAALADQIETYKVMVPKHIPKIISIEGNIGAGKTTIINHIEKRLCETGNTRIRVLKEPVDIWSTVTDMNGETILQKFYANPTKYAFPFQILAFITRISEMKKILEKYPDCEIIICERSLDADANIFAKMLYDDGHIDYISYQIYLSMFEEMSTDYIISKIFYLDIPVDICDQRIKQRGREGESNITNSYLEKCMKYHNEWLLQTPDLKYQVIHVKDPGAIIDYFTSLHI